MNKHKVTMIVMLIATLVIHIYNVELMPSRSSYSFNLGILDCDNIERLTGCRHEIGHKMDDDLGMPSLSKEFAIAIRAHVLVETRPMEVPDDVAILIKLYPDRDPREIYAAIYSLVDGDVERLPAFIQPFYSTDPSYLRLYDCLAQPGLNVCGRSVSYLKQ